MCRYLLRRCDNEPAPWSTSNIGDGPWEEDLPGEAYAELEADDAIDVLRVGMGSVEGQPPHWSYTRGAWGWAKPPPEAALKKSKNPLTSLQKQKRSVCFLCISTLALQFLPGLFGR